jgi:hypothetical protein
MDLKDFSLEPSTTYNGSLLVRKNEEDKFYPVSRTTKKILFYIDENGNERRLFPKKIGEVVKNKKKESEPESEDTEEVEDEEGGNFDSGFLKEEADKETFLFSGEENPFFGNDFAWATITDFAKDNDLMFT